MLNASRPFPISPEFQFNDTDASIFMEPSLNGTENSPFDDLPLIYPGTKWCGRGNISNSEDDLGIYEETDKCCREHDNCPESISARESRHGLFNDGDYTRSHCSCDEAFLNCLESDRSLSAFTSFKIANVYYNILKPTCFDRRHPVNSCLMRRLSGECIKFQYDTRLPATWQFFPAQAYVVRPARGLFDAIAQRSLEITLPPLPPTPTLPFSIQPPKLPPPPSIIQNFPKIG